MGKQAAIKGVGGPGPSHLQYHREKVMARKVRWAAHRGRLAESHRDDKKTREQRNVELVDARQTCEAERKAVTAGCKLRRDKIREKANTALAKQKKRRQDSWEDYREATGKRHYPGVKKAKRMSAKENDSLVEHNLAPEHIHFWRSVKRQFPTSLTPHQRYEAFMSYMHDHPEQYAEFMAQRAEAIDYEKLAQEHYAKEAAEYEEAVPF